MVVGLLSDASGDDGPELPESLNRLAVVGFVGAGLVAAVGLFALPTLLSYGLTFREGMVVIGVAELLAAFVAGLSGYYLFSPPES